MTTTVNTRILIISDTHCAPLLNETGGERPFSLPLPSADLLIHCGDLTNSGKVEEYHQALDMLKKIDAPVKLVIAGNHDISLDENYVLGHVGRKGAIGFWEKIDTLQAAKSTFKQASDLWFSESGKAKLEGITFLDEGLHEIDLLNGARVRVYTSPYTPKFCDFAFAYARNEDRFNPPEHSFTDTVNITKSPVPSYSSASPIDILVTHGPPYGRLDKTKSGDPVGCTNLLRAMVRSRPLVHCFGHIHEGWGAERIKWHGQADEVASSLTSNKGRKMKDWQTEVSKEIKAESFDDTAAITQHCASLNLTNNSGNAIKRGHETVAVNAAIMNVQNDPVNAPWLLDLALPKST